MSRRSWVQFPVWLLFCTLTGQIEHDREAVKSSRDKAIGDMWAFYEVKMTPEEEKIALRIFPAVYISYSLMQCLNL